METARELRQELDALKRKGEKTRLESRRELLSLRAKLKPLAKDLQQAGESIHLGIYQQQITFVFQKNLPTPYIQRILSQLCHALHCHEVQLKQLKIIKQWNKRIIVAYQKESKNLTEENKSRLQSLQNELSTAEASLKSLEKELESKVEQQEKDIDQLFEQVGNMSAFNGSFARLTGAGGGDVFDSAITETPMTLRKSKIWIDLTRNEEEDKDKVGELKKISSHGGLGSSRHSRYDDHTITKRGSASSTTSSSSHRASILDSFQKMVVGDFDFAGDEDETPMTPPNQRRPVLSRDSVREFVEHNDQPEAPLSPTIDALRKLTEEVFSF